MDTVKINIDEREVEVPKNYTIMQAAKSAKIRIPHLCYRADLKPIGGCRICVVELEGARSLVASCTQPVAEGMVVKTNTEKIITARKMVLELIISNHPLDCMTCEKTGGCKLQDYAYEYGVKGSRFKGEQTTYPIETTNEFFERDYSKCILCGRCVQVCQEVQYNGAIDNMNRGFFTKVGAEFDEPLQESPCYFCGSCVDSCPVGVFTEKTRKGVSRLWETSPVETICPYCGVGCSVIMHTKGDKIVYASAKPSKKTVNNGKLCCKGKFGFQFVNSPERLVTPLIRENGAFRKASWDSALNLIADKLLEIKRNHGADAIAGLSSAKCTNEENYVMQKFMRACIGTNNVDHCARLCHASTVAGLALAFGSGAMTNSISDLSSAECIFVIGSNTTEGHPVIALEIKKAAKANGAKVIIADPRKIDLVDFSVLHVRQKPGTDVALLNGMMNVIVNENLHNRDFIGARTENYDRFREAVINYTPDRVSDITGIRKDDIVKMARIYAGAKNSTIVYSMGITQHSHGTDNVLSIANLAMLTGNVGREGTGLNALRGQNNVQGSCDSGALPNVYPGYQKVDDPVIRGKFEKAWNAVLPEKPGLTVVEIMNSAHQGKVKAVYIMGENPALSDPNICHVKEALSKLDFLVAQDIFLTETAQFAHVVLPAVSFAEKEGTFTNTERRVQKLKRVIAPIGESRQDWEIICGVSSAMGYKMQYASPEEIMNEMASLTPIYGGIRYNRLDEGGLQWPCADINHQGTKVLHREKFTRGLGKFHPVEFIPSKELTDGEYPFTLTTGRILYHYHTGTMSRKSDGLNWKVPSAYVEINTADADDMGISNGETITVSSRRGAIEIASLVTDRVSRGVVFIPFHFAEAAANTLTIDAIDPVAKIPEYKVCAVKIAKKKS